MTVPCPLRQESGNAEAIQPIHQKCAFILSLRSLGDSLQIPQEVMKVCENFVCQLYQSDPVTTDINKVRYNLFCKHAKQNEGLPPCRDSLTQHVKRCNYQCVVWKSALVAKPDIPPPGGHGWIGTEDGLLPELMTQESAPKEVVSSLPPVDAKPPNVQRGSASVHSMD